MAAGSGNPQALAIEPLHHRHVAIDVGIGRLWIGTRMDR